ncbi:hypothetical protein G1L02_03620 [Tenacibaculum finnmarkense]|uniref:DUF6428 family protein n=1 Tax=Tenacibaculum finnmarkense TaxID=2781243 RepID=UPI001EFAFDF0|nr:DUF6428 family protein [Tenacibaculum finnmarkense]MCG8882248.1 hypothetical protein [Tenacibaculum finnmarkense]
MKLSEIKKHLSSLKNISFKLPNGELVPSHFHVTEVGKVTKNFIDCGGTLRTEELVNFQLWEADDYDHRLHPEKLMSIIALSEKVLHIADLDIEVEYQGTTIGKYGLDFDGTHFLLTSTLTDCLDKDKCGIPDAKATKISEKPKVKLAEIQEQTSCAPNSGCC